MYTLTKVSIGRQVALGFAKSTSRTQWRVVGGTDVISRRRSQGVERKDASNSCFPEGARSYSTTPSPQAAKGTEQNASIATFRSVIAGTQETSSTEEARSTLTPEADDVWFRVKTKQISAEEAWDLVQERFPSTSVDDHSWLLRNAIEIVMEAKAEAPLDPKLPSASRLAELYLTPLKDRSGELSIPTRVRPLVLLQEALVTCLAADDVRLGPGLADAHALKDDERQELFADMIKLWTLIFSWEHGGPASVSLSNVKVPRIPARLRHDIMQSRVPWAEYIRRCMSRASVSQIRGMAATFYVSYVLIISSGRRDSEIVQPLSKLLEELEKLLHFCRDQIMRAHGLNVTQTTFLNARTHLLLENLKSESQRPGGYHTMISQAFHARHTDRLRELWNEMRETLPPANEVSEEQRQTNGKELDFMAYAWAALGQRDSEEVLAFMSSNGYGPTTRTYTSLITGWRKSRQMHLIENLWSYLLQSEAPLDSILWSTRISSLVDVGKVGSAVDCLTLMAEKWTQAVEEGRQDQAAKPDVGVLNAVLVGVLRLNNFAGARKFLLWAEKHDIEPNVLTFNMILQRMLRRGLMVDVAEMLTLMKEKKVEPDAYTLNHVIKEVLGRVRNEDENMKVQAVNAIFATFKKMSTEPSIIAYATMLHTLLETESGTNRAAISLVFADMKTRECRPSPHIFTILAEDYFRRSDPEAVKDMIETWSLTPTTWINPPTTKEPSLEVDTIFWEVVIRGYAENGFTGDAKAVFFDLQPNARVSLSVANTLLDKLIAEGDMEAAVALVKRLRERTPPQDEWERYKRHHIWHVVEKYGLDAQPKAEGGDVYTV